jgi:hypothetical protein
VLVSIESEEGAENQTHNLTEAAVRKVLKNKASVISGIDRKMLGGDSRAKLDSDEEEGDDEEFEAPPEESEEEAAALAADIPGERINLLEQIVLQGSDFSEYIDRLNHFDGPEIAAAELAPPSPALSLRAALEDPKGPLNRLLDLVNGLTPLKPYPGGENHHLISRPHVPSGGGPLSCAILHFETRSLNMAGYHRKLRSDGTQVSLCWKLVGEAINSVFEGEDYFNASVASFNANPLVLPYDTTAEE